MTRCGQGVQHRIYDELAGAVDSGGGGSNYIKSIEQPLSSDQRWRLLGVQEKFGICDYWRGVRMRSC